MKENILLGLLIVGCYAIPSHAWHNDNPFLNSRWSPKGMPFTVGREFPHLGFANGLHRGQYYWYPQQQPSVSNTGPTVGTAEWICRNPKTGDMIIVTSEDASAQQPQGQHPQQYPQQPQEQYPPHYPQQPQGHHPPHHPQQPQEQHPPQYPQQPQEQFPPQYPQQPQEQFPPQYPQQPQEQFPPQYPQQPQEQFPPQYPQQPQEQFPPQYPQQPQEHLQQHPQHPNGVYPQQNPVQHPQLHPQQNPQETQEQYSQQYSQRPKHVTPSSDKEDRNPGNEQIEKVTSILPGNIESATENSGGIGLIDIRMGA